MVRLNIATPSQKVHDGLVSGLCWSRGNELFTAGDNNAIEKWSVNGESLGKFCDIDGGEGVTVTVLKVRPNTGSSQQEEFVVGCTDGVIRFFNVVSSRESKKSEAHHGSVTSLVWSGDGSTLASGGEDGIVRIWSAGGMLRVPTFHNTGQCVYSLCYSGNRSDILITCGTDLIIKSTQATHGRHLVWKAHDGIVLATDWSHLAGLIVSGGEDGKYKVWDAFGRNLYTSDASQHPTTCVRFSPDSSMFAVGGYGTIRVCDAKGWTLSRESIDIDDGNTDDAPVANVEEDDAPKRTAVAERVLVGSVMDLAWGHDNGMLAAGTGEGRVVFTQIVDRRMDWKHCVVEHTDPMRVVVHNVRNDTQEELVQRDKVVRMAIGFGYIIIATVTQVSIYNASELTDQPRVFDVKDVITLILTCATCFLTVDLEAGVRIFDYRGTQLSTLQLVGGMMVHNLSKSVISLSSDTVCVRGGDDTRTLYFFEVQSGRLATTMPKHTHVSPIMECQLNHFGGTDDRKAVIVDLNKDMYLLRAAHNVKSTGTGTRGEIQVELDQNGVPILNPFRIRMLSPMVESVRWNDIADSLVALADRSLVTWYHPGIVFVDKDLLPRIRVTTADAVFGANDVIDSFVDSFVQVRRGVDGAMLTYATSPYPKNLFKQIKHSRWDCALRLCRYIKDPCMWAILASSAVAEGSRYNEARDAYSALQEGAKIMYLRYVMSIPSKEGRSAELSLFQGRPDIAEGILISAGLVHRAIKMYIGLHRWEQALSLALHHRSHIDTVLFYRRKALAVVQKQETHEAFMRLNNGEIEVDEALIISKEEEAKRHEESLQDAAPLEPDEMDG